ncbi:MAG: hypothetical protein IIX39_07360, partial [Clostridia bacterium]|nr:hypothetical protein [Clostridia bacterium]
MKKEKLKKRLLSALCVILVIVALATLVGPHLVLLGARQPDVEDSYAYSEYFYNSYDEIRAHLKDRVMKLKNDGVAVEVSEYAVDEKDNLYIDNLYLPAPEADGIISQFDGCKKLKEKDITYYKNLDSVFDIFK